MGKQNSGFELATGLLPWARRIILCSPSPAKLSVNTRSLVGVRARYVQPFEDHVLGGGVAILDASIGGIVRGPAGSDAPFVVTLRPSDGGEDLVLEVDEVIAATGFVTPLLDLPALGVTTFGQAKLPAQTPYWESATVPGIFFAGTIGQGSAGLKKHGMPANSGAVHGARYNARVLARHIARTHGSGGGVGPAGATARGGSPDRALTAGTLVDAIVSDLATAPELWHQRAYLAKVISLDPTAGIARCRRRSARGVRRWGRGRRQRRCPRDHARGRRHGRDLPRPVPPPGRQGRRAPDRGGRAPAVRHSGDADGGSTAILAEAGIR